MALFKKKPAAPVEDAGGVESKFEDSQFADSKLDEQPGDTPEAKAKKKKNRKKVWDKAVAMPSKRQQFQ